MAKNVTATVVTKNSTVAAEPQGIPLKLNEKYSVIHGVNIALRLLYLCTCLRTIWILQNWKLFELSLQSTSDSKASNRPPKSIQDFSLFQNPCLPFDVLLSLFIQPRSDALCTLKRLRQSHEKYTEIISNGPRRARIPPNSC